MKKPRIRGKLAPKSVVNPKHGMQFVPVVGKFMVNFGAVELLTYAWFDHQARDDVLIDHAFTLPFGRRVDLILKMVEREGMPDEWKERSTNAWKEAKQLSEVRNDIAHNPVGWQGSEEGDPQVLGIPVTKKLRESGQVPFYDLDGLIEASDAVVGVVRKLEGLIEELRTKKQEDS